MYKKHRLFLYIEIRTHFNIRYLYIAIPNYLKGFLKGFVIEEGRSPQPKNKNKNIGLSMVTVLAQ